VTRTLGPYELRSELGRGAMAVVWRAYDPVLDREVALKEAVVAHGTDAATAGELATRFVREARAAARLSHPGIVTVYAADVYEGRPVIAMELIRGATLGQMLRRGRLSPQVVLGHFDQLLEAVAYAHDQGIVHRDIKPDNIFITTDGRVKLGDFGVAHLGGGTALTQAGTIMGTPGYMAPEQIRGEAVDARADIFALGVVLHEMLTGANPFGADAQTCITTVIFRIIQEPAPPLPPSVTAAFAHDIRPALAAALAKDPRERFADARSFMSALRGEGPARMSRHFGMHGTPP
jgi:serine/threonine protein kinase